MTRIKITILLDKTPFFTRNIDDGIKIAKLKLGIFSDKEIPVEQQLLVHYRRILRDDETLKSIGIGDNSNIALRECPL
jgi:hypothetical protein